MLLRKNVYPYEYVTDQSCFLKTSLPCKNAFYSQLSQSHISNADYAHAKHVWNTMDIRNMGEYHDLYLKSDVLLLCDVFENFRDFALREYGLDPAWYYTLPGFAWDAMLKMTGVNIELLTDVDKYLFCEKAKRGGVSMIATKYAKANNKYCPDYDNEKPNKYLIDLDANNLYGWAGTTSSY